MYCDTDANFSNTPIICKLILESQLNVWAISYCALLVMHSCAHQNIYICIAMALYMHM